MWVTDFLVECWRILTESAIYILVGFVIAGLLHTVMSRGNWARLLRGVGAKSVLLASAVGLPLPLCSCSVLPTAVSLRRGGASKGATLSFLISTPETSVQSVMLTYGLLGPVMAVIRPIASAVTALLAGLMENFAERFGVAKSWAISAAEREEASDAAAACCGCGDEAPAEADAEASCCGPADQVVKQRVTWLQGVRYAFVDVFDDVMGWMWLGIFVAAAIQVAMPGYVIDSVFGPAWQAMLIMLVVGVPLYVCNEASTPIAAVLISQGVNPGAALVFLLAGPATNIGSVGLLTRELGKRAIIIYLATIAVVSLAFGAITNWFLASRGIDLKERVFSEPLLPEWLKAAGAVALLVLCLWTLLRLRYFHRLVGAFDRALPVRVTPARFLATLLLVLLVGYASTGLYAIQPGQLGMVETFGQVTKAEVGPGLHVTWPWPIGRVQRVDSRAVRRLVLGYRIGPDGGITEEDDAVEAWVLLGDENIASVKSVAHWRMKPDAAWAFAYHAADNEKVVRAAIRSAIRAELGDAVIDTILTVDRETYAVRVQKYAQDVLDHCDVGIELVWFDFLDMHAPPAVHDAFRDVASALENKSTQVNRALELQASIVPLARGQAARAVTDAEAAKLRSIAQATGEAVRFLAQEAAHREYPTITRLRLLFEMYDRILPGRRKLIQPESGNFELDWRFGSKAQQEAPAF